MPRFLRTLAAALAASSLAIATMAGASAPCGTDEASRVSVATGANGTATTHDCDTGRTDASGERAPTGDAHRCVMVAPCSSVALGLPCPVEPARDLRAHGWPLPDIAAHPADVDLTPQAPPPRG